MAPSFKTVDDYIFSFPEHVKDLLISVRNTIHSAAPDATEGFSYGVPAFKQNGNLVLYAAFKDHIGFYPTPSAIVKFKNELSPYETAKGTVKFPFHKPIPLALITKIVKFKIKENQKS